MNKDEVGMVYDTVLCTPGMEEQVKVDFKSERRVLLLLSQVLERGLVAKPADGAFGLPDVADKDSIGVLRKLSADWLEKAGLTALNDKLIKLKTA